FRGAGHLEAVSDDTKCFVTTPEHNGGTPSLWRPGFRHQLSRLTAAAVAWTVAMLLVPMLWLQASNRKATLRRSPISELTGQTQRCGAFTAADCGYLQCLLHSSWLRWHACLLPLAAAGRHGCAVSHGCPVSIPALSAGPGAMMFVLLSNGA